MATSTTLLPQAFWFRLAMPCRRVENLPKKGGTRLLDLADNCRLPETSRLDGKSPWAVVKTAWDSGGLAVEAEVESSLDNLLPPEFSPSPHGLTIWVDTRDTRDMSRASRFCHAFEFLIAPGKGKSAAPVLNLRQKPIPRAIADAKICDPQDIHSRLDKIKTGYRIEVFLPSKVLNGFDPETNRRLGFAYQVSDPDREGQVLGTGTPFPINENPTLWSTLELVD